VLRYFLRLCTSGFGGPTAVAGYMQRDLVEQRGWTAREDLLNGVAPGQTCPARSPPRSPCDPGPCAAVAFIIRSFLMVTAVAPGEPARPPPSRTTRTPLARQPRRLRQPGY
jgi:chromate transporter